MDITHFCLAIHQLIDIWVVSTFWLLLSIAAMNICVQVFVWTHVLNSFKYIPRSGIAGLYGNSLFNF